MIVMKVGRRIFEGSGWAPVIAWESVWLVAAILLSSVLPSGIRHDISFKSTIEGLKLDWPELLYATLTLGYFSAYVGGIRLDAGPIAMSLAVGIGEEFIFRVLLLGWLVSKLPAAHALTVSSLVFGFAHLHEISVLGFVSVMPQTAGGFVLGAVYLRTRNPIAPILGHAFWDFPYFMVIGMGVSGGGTEAGMPSLSSMAPWVAFTIYGLWLVRDGIPLVGRHDPVDGSCAGCHQPVPVRRQNAYW